MLQHHLLLTYSLTSTANSPANMEALWKCVGAFFVCFLFCVCLVLFSVTFENSWRAEKIQKPKEGEETNMMLIFDLRTDLVVAILVNLISVPVKKKEN